MLTISSRVIKRIIRFTPWLILLIACHAVATPISFKVASFNIHYIQPAKNHMDWDARKEAVIRVLKDIDADMIAFQEMETFEGSSFSYRNLQLDWIAQNLPDYFLAAVGNPEKYPSTQPILYRKLEFKVEEQGFFFFSENPDQIYSRQWNGSYPYFCSWVRFKHLKSGKTFTLFNVHNDYSSKDNRIKTSQLVVSRVNPLLDKQKPLLIVGDFNAPSWFETMSILKDAGLQLAKPSGSTHHFNLGLNLLPAIDHMLASLEITFNGPVKVWRNQYDGVWPSDHYPISVEVHIK
jgi:endonuclease/exonuclease/phosphatase family metal-dependent hydrolase